MMEAEIRDTVKNDAWNQVYTDIRIRSLVPKWTSLEASRPENRSLNRYRDVSPYDHSRVVLKGAGRTDYINASLVKAPNADRQYILAQGPLAGTVSHFWLMIWEQESKAVLMLNRIFEKGVEKCHQYWPRDAGGEFRFPDVGLRVENVSSEPGEHYTVRKLRLSKIPREEGGGSDDEEEFENGEEKQNGSQEKEEEQEVQEDSREILHFHYTTWPDFGTPACPDTFLEFLKAVRDSGSLGEDVGPPVVHCSAGIGRSGTFVLVDTCLVLVAKEGSSRVCIRDTLLDMRNYRMGLIQTPDQLKFSYLAIAEGAKELNLISANILADLREELASSCDDDGPPPPLPPPRSESLMKSASSSSSTPSSASSAASSDLAAAMLMGAASSSLNNGHDGLGPSSSYGNTDNRLSPNVANGGAADLPSSSCGSSAEPSPAALGLEPAPSSTTTTSSSGGESQPKTDHNSSSSCSTPTYLLSNHKLEERKREMEVRRRKKEEQTAALESKIEAIKRKTREAEEWEKKKQRVRDSLLPFVVGAAVLAVAVYFKG